MRAFFLLILAGLIVGCGFGRASALKRLTQDFETAKATCNMQFPQPDAKPIVPRVKCHNRAVLTFVRTVQPRDVDLYEVATAEITLAAEEYDSGKITYSEFEVRRAQYKSRVSDKLLARNHNATVANAAQTQAWAATRAANRSTTCTTIGNTTSCY